MSVEKIKVKVTDDYMAKVYRAKPEDAIAELIWNAFDADASEVSVNFTSSETGLAVGARKIVIEDNGTSIPWDEREQLFGFLGLSWKKQTQATKGGRETHGSEGQGRFKSFALGRYVTWHVVYKDGESFKTYSIKGDSSFPTDFEFTSPTLSKAKRTGVTVEIDSLARNFLFLDDSSLLLQKVAPIFSLYLNKYKSIFLQVAGEKIDPSIYIIKDDYEIELDKIPYEGEEYSFKLKIIEWDSNAVGTQKSVMLCDKSSFPLEEYDKQIRNIGGYSFTAYLCSEAFRKMNHKGILSLGELSQDVSKAVEEAIKSIKGYFKQRKIEDNQTIFDAWQKEGSYPYQPEELLKIETGKAQPVEKAEKELFDILALTIREHLPNFDNDPIVTKKFQLHMLRQAVESGENTLKKIFSEVIKLKESEREELITLLEESSLSNIIKTSKEVSDRIKFITGLEELIYDKDISKHIKERSQLHKILADNAWVFGEQFTLSVNDQSLTEVLRKFLATQKDTEIVVDEPVTRIDGSKGIVDLMLTRSLGHARPNENHYIVVELKAPKVHIGKKECRQVDDYMLAVTSDARFKGGRSRWEFWIVGDDYASDGYVERKLQDAYGLIEKNETDGLSYEVRAIRWATLFDNTKHRLDYLRKQLNVTISKKDSLKFLKEKYASYTETLIIGDDG